jgi:thymidylate kinase
MKTINTPYFIALEGIDNAGKTTVAGKIKELLLKKRS